MAKIEMKQPIVEEIKANMEGALSAILIDYRGLTVAQDTELRNKLRAEGIVYKVYKNTMLNLAFEGTEFEALNDDLKGPTAVAFSKEDATAAARVIDKLLDTIPALEFKSGVVNGTYFDQQGISAIAKIPSRDVLLGRLLGSLQSPITNFARVIKQIAEKEDVA